KRGSSIMYVHIRIIIGAALATVVAAVAWQLITGSDASAETNSAAMFSNALQILDGDVVVPDMFMELPPSWADVAEDDPEYDCRVDGNQICGYDAFVPGPFGEPMRVAPGYYGLHWHGEIDNDDARATLGLPMAH
ncbi:hypothetical protein ACW9HQ_52035, partial [Nocardia gipuzkoensis]